MDNDAPTPRFELRRHGQVLVVEVDGLTINLGPIEAAMEVLADFLGEQDFGERARSGA